MVGAWFPLSCIDLRITADRPIYGNEVGDNNIRSLVLCVGM